MDDRTELLRAWLEGEAERQQRPILPPPATNDPDPRGWVQVGLCAFLGSLAVALLAGGRVRVSEETARASVMNQLRLEGLRIAVGDPNKSAWWDERGLTAGSSDEAQVLLLWVRLFQFAFGTVIGALFLRAACSLYNKLVGGNASPGSVPEPGFVKAMGITFVATLVNMVVGIGLLSSLASLLATAGMHSALIVFVGVGLLSSLVSLLVMAGMISALLPTTFARGFLVALCYLLVGLMVIVVLAVFLGGLFLVHALMR